MQTYNAVCKWFETGLKIYLQTIPFTRRKGGEKKDRCNRRKKKRMKAGTHGLSPDEGRTPKRTSTIQTSLHPAGAESAHYMCIMFLSLLATLENLMLTTTSKSNQNLRTMHLLLECP